LTLIDAADAPLAQGLSTWRSLDPPGVLPHLARALDGETDATEFEAEIDVELLSIDATSYRAIRERSDADPQRMASTISEIVAERGKLQNPWTGSGGVLMGRVQHVGHAHPGDIQIGGQVMPLASLIAVPLRLSSVGPLDPSSPHVPVRGRAIVTPRMSCVRVPPDLPKLVALTAFDVFPVASYARVMAAPGAHVLVLGAGHAGLLALAAAREAVSDSGRMTAVDVSQAALERASAVDPGVVPIEADVTDSVAVATALVERELPPADLTLLCTTVQGAEGTAILTTADHGTVLFFSTATSFAAAALGADAIGSHARLVIPNGLTEDRGEYAFELLRRTPVLRELFEAGT
jgi:L-erythro-3,5-diaminohexanoate dehydrogenase